MLLYRCVRCVLYDSQAGVFLASPVFDATGCLISGLLWQIQTTVSCFVEGYNNHFPLCSVRMVPVLFCLTTAQVSSSDDTFAIPSRQVMNVSLCTARRECMHSTD